MTDRDARFAGKTAIITGAGAGISLATAHRFLANAIGFLASDEVRNNNGVVLPSDGGWSVI